MAEGYLYVFSNESMPGIMKIGMTERTPEARLAEANASDTFKPPTPYKLEIAKKVTQALAKERILHAILADRRVNPSREFFRMTTGEVCLYFMLMDGEIWQKSQEQPRPPEQEEGDSDEGANGDFYMACRDMTRCFTNGQRIRHIIGDKTWVGTYDSSRNGILRGETFYKSLSAFAKAHYALENPARKSANGWAECECETEDARWKSTANLGMP
jgi:hypothetical protein